MNRRGTQRPCPAWLSILLLGGGLAISAVCSCAASLPSADDQALLQAAAVGQGVQTLLDQGASPNAAGPDGRTPLHIAAAHGHLATSELLVRYGAKPQTRDDAAKTPLDLARDAGHEGVAGFLASLTNRAEQPPSNAKRDSTVPALKPGLRWKTLAEFEAEIRERGVLLDSPRLSFYAPARRETEARLVFDYLKKAYDALYAITGVHTDYKVAIFAFPRGNTNGWGGTSECSIEYGEASLDLLRQPEWLRYRVPHVSGFIEELAHNFVRASRAQFGWEALGWSLGTEATRKVASNPDFERVLTSTRAQQAKTFERYMNAGGRFPTDLPANLCDRIHAHLLNQAAAQYGPKLWPDFFHQVRAARAALLDAENAGDADQIRNRRYQITIGCFEKILDPPFHQALTNAHISLTTDVRSLHPEKPQWDRRLRE